MWMLEIYAKTATPWLMVLISTYFYPGYSFVMSHQASSKTHLPVILYSIRKERRTSDVSNSKGGKEPNISPGYQFFQGDGSYVPSGMSREDYTKLRKDEIEKEGRMNYGAWGPRFKRTGIPEGDWMIMPNLWTAGRVDRSSSRSGNNNEMVETPSRPIRALFRVFKTYSATWFLVYLLLGCLQIGFCLWKFREEHMNPYAIFLLEAILLRKQLSRLMMIKVETIKLLLSLSLAPFVNNAVERLNRRFLWSKRRISLTTLVFTVGLVGLWWLLLQLATFP
jgi:hypothetical protein